MRKVVIEKPGSYDALKIKEVPDPSPSKNEVLIDVKATGVNFADCCIRMGVYSSAKEFVGWPITPGFEVSGVVSKVGEGVTKFSRGDKVIATTRFGGYASCIAVDESQVFPLPKDFNFIQGAAFLVNFLTAFYALFELALPRKKAAILVHSAAGGVGSALLQLCRLAGTEVVGVVGSAHKAKALAASGVKVIDKSSQNLWKEVEKLFPKGFDIIFDANGAETLQQSYNHLRSGGKLVVYGFHTMFTKGKGTPNWFKMAWDYFRTPKFNPLEMTNQNRSVLAFNLSYLFDRSDLFQEGIQSLLTLVEKKKIRLPPIETYPIEQVAEAHRALESGQTIGKLVLTF